MAFASKSSCSTFFVNSSFLAMVSPTWKFINTHPGILLVAIGVAGNVFFTWHSTKTRKEALARFCEIVLVAGLILEIWEAVRQDKEVAIASTQAAEAMDRAGKAEKEAADATLLAARIQKRNFTLRKDLAELSLKVRPRIITAEQVTNFIFLTGKLKKIPVTVSLGQSGNDTETFAAQLREMLSKAGFGTNEGGFWGVKRDSSRVVYKYVGSKINFSDLVIVYPSSDSTNFLTASISCEITNGFQRPIVMESTNDDQIYVGIILALKQIGFATEAMENTGWQGVHGIELYVPMKGQF